MVELEPITLANAMKSGRLQDFIAQEEARGIGPIGRAELNLAIAALIKAPQSEDQTSHCPSGDNSTGKRIRQGSGQRIPR